MASQKRYRPEELNSAVDAYCQALKAIQALPPGETGTSAHDVLESSAVAILKMVEPLLLTYFRFLTGNKDYQCREIRLFLRLFDNKSGTDYGVLAERVVRGVRSCVVTSNQDQTLEPVEGKGYFGNDIYSWFIEILMTEVLPKYRVMYKDDGVTRINFFKYFQDKFRYCLATRIKKQIAWEGRTSSVEDMPGYDPIDPTIDHLQDDLGMSGIEWRYFQGLISPTHHRRKTLTIGQQVLESQIAGRLVQFRTGQSDARSRLDSLRG